MTCVVSEVSSFGLKGLIIMELVKVKDILSTEWKSS